VTHRSQIVLGLVVSSALCIAATVYLVAVGARIDTQTTPLSPVETYLSAGGLLAGVSGLAVFLGLALRRPAARPSRVPGAPTMPND
jgi:membrane protein implicated in regulation of membrane protease activity